MLTSFSVHSPNLLKETSHFQDDSVSSSTSNEAAPAEESSSSEDKSAPPGAAADDVKDKEEPVKEKEVEEEEASISSFCIGLYQSYNLKCHFLFATSQVVEEVKKVPKSKTWFLGGRMAKAKAKGGGGKGRRRSALT